MRGNSLFYGLLAIAGIWLIHAQFGRILKRERNWVVMVVRDAIELHELKPRKELIDA